MSETIRLVLVKRNKTAKDLAEPLGCSSQNVYSHLKKNNWSEDQLRKIADYLNCDLKIEFQLRDTKEIF